LYTELHAFQDATEEFAKRNTIVIGASCDTNEVHFAWLNTPKDNGGIEGNLSNLSRYTQTSFFYLRYFRSDVDYDDETGEEVYSGGNVTYRATYLIDETGKIFHESVNDMPLGRNVQELHETNRCLYTRTKARRSLSCKLGRR
jgi:peroxiredoxin (alkyl hydroperoxide reductase subunit C)